MAEAKITTVNPTTFELEDYSSSDENLISSIEVSTLFNPDTDYIEYFVYNPNNGGLFFPPIGSPANYTNYTLEDNILNINPEADLNLIGITEGSFNTFYNFLSTKLDSSFTQRYYISEISSNRTEIRLASNDIPTENLISSSLDYIQERNLDEYYPDFYLNFGNNQLVIANNILLDGDTILIKLYEPLPPQYQLKNTLWVVEQVANAVAYLVEFPSTPIIVDNSIKLRGPNVNLKVKGEVNNSTEALDFTSLTDTSISSSLQQINSFYADPSVKINVDYTEFSNFIKFSSAEKRLNNFFYKIQQIEDWTKSAASGSNVVKTNTSSSTAFYQNQINETIDQFDNYEYFLYFSSGSKSYPKTNTDQPYNQATSTSTLVQNWITASIATASLYDSNNQDWIYYAIPEYIREDVANQPYLDFSNMVGHFYDENIWVYIKDITNKWDSDNRIDAGISRDLIAQQLRDLGFKLYENQFSSFNLFSATLGLTPSGSYFPFPYMTGSLPTPSGFEYVNASITGSNEILPQDDVNKRLYKRIYNNLSYLYKKKGTIDGIRTLATIYGIPNTLLRIDEFGSKDKTNVNDWDYWFEQFNYAYSTGDDGIISSDWSINTDWNTPDDVPESLQFRFKLPPSSSLPSSQSLWTLDDGAEVRLVLEYDTSSLSSGSFSGSIPNPNNQYADLKFYPNFSTDATEFASISLPFANTGWWSVMINREGGDFELIAANKIYKGSNGSSLGFIASSSITATDDGSWFSSTNSYFPTLGGITGYDDFSGSYQEIRYYTTQISHSVFKDYVMNPQSIEGNTINSAPDELVFRASLGGELYTGSVSIHPKVTGSWDTLNSFPANSNFTITEGSFDVNREYVFMDQPAVGIKNRITDKIRQIDLNLPEGSQQLSNIRSIQQDTETDDAYTNTVNQVEVVLSPTNQINDDIISSIGYLNIGEYIGDPREAISGSTSYRELDDLRDDYFLKYTGNYDWTDFTRLIKFFDNSLFKVIKDFIPSKISSATGISIKQHLLERQKQPAPSASYSEPVYTGSIGQVEGLLDGQRIYTASGDYDSFPIESVTGSQGGTLPTFVPDTNYTVDQIVNVTQSWDGSYMTPFGAQDFTIDDAREFINGEFSGSALVATTQSLNPGCDHLKIEDTTIIVYDVDHYTNNDFGTNKLTPPISQQWPLQNFTSITSPNVSSGEVSLWWNASRVVTDNGVLGKTFTDTFSPGYIAISKNSVNSLDLDSAITNVTQFIILTNTLSPSVPSYFGYGSITTTVSTITLDVLGFKEYTDSYLIEVSSQDNITLTSSNTPGDPVPEPFPVQITAESNVQTVFSPFFTSNFSNSDCNPLINNDVIARKSNIFWDVDYTTNAIQAVNYQALISASQQDGSLVKADIQDYNWYSTPITRRNYAGAKSTAPDFNLNSTEGGFGQLPVVESKGYYFAYFNWVGGTSPVWGNGLGDRSAVNIRYYIGEDGNVIEPINDVNGVNLSIAQQNFEQDSNAILSFNDTEGSTSQFTNLEGTHKIFKSGQLPQPIVYSQTESIASGSNGGYSSLLTFVQGDQQGVAVDDYRLTSNVSIADLGLVTTIPFPNITVQGDEAGFTTNTTYSPTTSPNTQTPSVALNFEVYLESSIINSNAQASIEIKQNTTVIAQGVFDLAQGNNFTLQKSVTGVVASDDFTVTVASHTQNTLGGVTNLTINSNSFLKVTQTPPASTGNATPDYWAVTNNEITPDGLSQFYGQRQEDISDSGFNPITMDFTLEIGDEFRFDGTETQTYIITSQSIAAGKPVFHVDRNVTAANTNWFLVRRYINDPSYIILEVDKPAGGTSQGVLTPEYFYGETEEKVDSILKELKRDNLI